MTETLETTIPFKARPADRAPEILLRQGHGLHLQRVLAFTVDYSLYITVAFALSVFATMLIESLSWWWVAPEHAFGDLPARLGETPYVLSKSLAALVTLALAIAYTALTLGGRYQATLGMRLFRLRLERLDSVEITPRYAVAHTLLFLATTAMFTPLVLLAPLVLANRQMLHDRLLDTLMLRTG
ncbi:RDD family protein [Nitratireductor sp. GISD-1A_MAKvit]|uniref:RDD family protein n=1 Tax=Nitratireductor sp. GISD-1A_MAKvit TaxID=3234198 RepID=UPI00346582FE